jgi:hypothetical protein
MNLLSKIEKDKLRKALRDYIRSAIRVANPTCYSKRKEGYWQNYLCIEWGRCSLPSEKYTVIDRECVIGFDSGSERASFYDSVLKPYAEVRERLQKTLPNIFGKFRDKQFGDNLDMLALDEQGNLVVIELKHGSNVPGIYWGPLQVLAYRDAFKGKLGIIARDMEKLVRQKVNLGLLPRAALSRLPINTSPTSIKAVLAIAEPSRTSEKCWDKLNQVVSETRVSCSTEDMDDIRTITIN